MKYIAIIAALAAVAAASPVRADDTATVDPAQAGQTLEGWGTSLCWMGNVIGGFPDKARADYIAKIFDAKQGLGMNIARYNIGGGENPNIPNTMEVRARMPGFEPSDGVWDWNADANQRRFLAEAIKKGVNIVEGFSNSPPYWMTLSGSVAGAPDGRNNLNPAYYQKFADYLAEVTRHFHDHWGVTFRTLEPMNESTTTYWKKGGRQEGYHIDPRNDRNEDQNTLVKLLAASLAQRHSPTQVSANDDTNIDITVDAVRSYDDAAKAAISQINTHTYGGSHRTQLHDLAVSLGKRLWMSEHGDGDGTGLTMSRDILADFKQMGCTAWVYWQAVDGGGWGMLNKDNNDTAHYDYTLNEKYWVMAQYSRFIRPGFRFLAVDDANCLAAYQPSQGTLVIVTTNSSKTDTSVTYDLSRFRRLPKNVTVYRTSPTESLAKLPDVTLSGGHFAAPSPAGSVTTFIVSRAF